MGARCDMRGGGRDVSSAPIRSRHAKREYVSECPLVCQHVRMSESGVQTMLLVRRAEARLQPRPTDLPNVWPTQTMSAHHFRSLSVR